MSRQDSGQRLAPSGDSTGSSGAPANRLRAASTLSRMPSSSGGVGESQEIFMLPRQKSGSGRGRRESRMFLVDGQLCWADDLAQANAAGNNQLAGKRNSSIGLMFGSSMDLSGLIGQSIDSLGASGGSGGSGSEEAISYRIKWCRDNIMQLKRQTWPMEKKLQVLKASKMFIKQHQGELKQSKQAKDVLANTSAIFERYWRHFKRELANFLVIITPWEMRIKKIESHFGSVVASYFTFLRWIFWLNLANSLVMVCFVMVPELIENVPDLTGMRKGELGMKRVEGTASQPPEFNPTLGEMWEFEGFLKFSPIFYGYYSNVEISRSGFWRNPLAFLLSAMLTYLFCFFCISRKLSQNTKLSRIGSKDDEYTFCWTVFVGWDFMIGNSETAYNKTSSLVMNLKEGILEEKEQSKDRDWRLIIRRVMANLLTIMLIIASAYVVTLAVQRSENLPEDASLLQKNELQLVMSGIQFMFPPLFDVIGIIEKYHPRKALSWQLGRILFLDFLNFYTLMFSLFGTVDQMSNQLNEVQGNITVLRKNATYIYNLFTTTTTTTTTTTAATTTPIVNATSSSTSDLTSTIASILRSNETTFASSSEMSNSTHQLVVSSTPMSNANATLMTSLLLLGSSIMSSTTQTSLQTTIMSTSSEPTLLPSIKSTMFPSDTLASTREPQMSTYSSTSATTLAPTEDEDYPEVEEILAGSRQAKRRRRKRKRKRQIDEEMERDESILIDPRGQPPADRTHERLAGLPPIRDPFGKLGRRQQMTSTPSPGGNEGEEDEMEPIEGRLEIPYRASTSSTIRSTIRSTMTTRAHLKPGRLSGLDADSAEETVDGNQEIEGARDDSNILIDRARELAAPALVTSTTGTAMPSAANASLESLTSPISPIISITSTTVDEQGATNLRPTNRTGFSNVGSLLGHQEEPAGARSTGSCVGDNENKSAIVDSSALVQDGLNMTQVKLLNAELLGVVANVKTGETNEVALNKSEEEKCVEIPKFKHQEILALNETLKEKLKTLCWETMFGQEMVKIVVMDLVMTIVSAVSFEFMRACFVRYCNRFFFWDLERGFPGYQDFKLAENVLHLVNNQSTVWMGMFFAPGLPAINTVKLAVLMYVRSWAVLTCNIPHETVFKVSKSNNFYYWILLINLLICILPVAYAVTWIRPSWHCGPFGGECRMYLVVTKLIKQLLPPEANTAFRYITSPGAVVPILIALILIIYYLASTVSSSKEANKELKAQLKKDKEQEAAVPEITNTTVVDSAIVAGAGGEPTAGNGGQKQPTVTPTAAAASELLVGRPKSLLMPPGM